MKHLVYLALAAGALAMTGCGGAAPPKPADPPAAAPAPTTPAAAEYSCGDGYVFDTDQVPGPEGAVVNDVFYWGSSTSGAARCYSATRNNSMVGRVESNAGDATGATVMSVTLSDELRWYFILEFSDGTYCSAATAGDGRATCFATVERDATGFRLDDLPAVPLPVPTGAPERPPGVPESPPGVPESPPGGPGPGGGDDGGGQTGAPEPEETVDFSWQIGKVYTIHWEDLDSNWYSNNKGDHVGGYLFYVRGLNPNSYGRCTHYYARDGVVSLSRYTWKADCGPLPGQQKCDITSSEFDESILPLEIKIFTHLLEPTDISQPPRFRPDPDFLSETNDGGYRVSPTEESKGSLTFKIAFINRYVALRKSSADLYHCAVKSNRFSWATFFSDDEYTVSYRVYEEPDGPGGGDEGGGNTGASVSSGPTP